MRGRNLRHVTIVIAAVCSTCLLSIHSSNAQVFASDDAGNGVFITDPATYVRVWTNGMNSGFGFTTPWVLRQTVRDDAHQVYAGFYNNNGDNIATTNNSSWGMYANGNWNGQTPLYNGTNKAVAYRGFASLTTNQVFKVQWQSQGIAYGGTANNRAGFSLRTGNTNASFRDYDAGTRFAFYYAASGTNSFLVRDGSGSLATGIPFTTAGLNCEFKLDSPDTYRFVVKHAVNGNILYKGSSRPLSGAGTIDSVSLYDLQCEDGDQNFNRIQIVASAMIPPMITGVQPAHGTFSVNPASKNVSFNVDSYTSTLVGSNVTLLLNGVEQTLAFNTTEATNLLVVTNTTPLASNVVYNAAIIATDANGASATNNFTFYTLQPFDPNDYGAAGNGTTKDTAAIQAAINACTPGGYVLLRNGTFLSGTIYLKDNMTFYIAPTATLLGSGSVADYPTLDPPTDNGQKRNCQKGLIYAEGKTNITIEGGGKINGNGRDYFRSGSEPTRPISIWTVLCDYVTIRNITIIDAAMWTIVPMETDHLFISDVVIDDDGLNGNRDGIDPVDCWHVVIQNCTFNTGDDSICLKSGNERGVNDVLVRNCKIVKSQSNGLKFGTASVGPFKNIVFEDCLVQNTDHSVMAVESVDGSDISDVIFRRINFSACQNAIFIILGSRGGAAVGSVSNILFEDIRGTSLDDTRGNPISGTTTNGVTYRLRDIRFNNVNIAFKGGLASVPGPPPEYVGQYPENTMWGNLPAYGYYIRHATGVIFSNCFSKAVSADARPWIATNDVSDLRIFGPPLNSTRTSTELILRWHIGYSLQAATNVNGPYLDQIGASSPHTNQFTGGTWKFFRLRN